MTPVKAAGRAAVSMGFSDEVTFDSKPWTSNQISDKAGLEELAKKLNPVRLSR